MKFNEIQEQIKNSIIPAVPIPFNSDGSINGDSQKSFAKWMDKQPIKCVAIWAHTGRGLYISQQQREEVFNDWRENLSHDKLILCSVGAAYDDSIDDKAYIEKAVQMAEHAKKLGADLVLTYAPTLFRNREDQDEMIVKYHQSIAEVGLPMILFYLYEEAGGISYSKDVLRKLFSIENVIGIKMATLDSVMTYQDVSNLIKEEAPHISLITGEDRMFGYTIMRGAVGALVGLGSIYTKLQDDMMQAYYNGNYKEFIENSIIVDNLAEHTFYQPMEGYIGRLLYILAKKGIINMESTYDPYGPPITDAEKERIDKFIEELGEM